MDALLRDLSAQVESAQNWSLIPADHTAPTLIMPLPALPDRPARGVLILVRAPQRPGFDGHERLLAATAANFLSARLP